MPSIFFHCKLTSSRSALRLLELAGVASLLFSPQTRQEQLLLGSLLTLAGDIFFDIPRIITESTLEYHKSSSKFCSIERDLTLQRERKFLYCSISNVMSV